MLDIFGEEYLHVSLCEVPFTIDSTTKVLRSEKSCLTYIKDFRIWKQMLCVERKDN